MPSQKPSTQTLTAILRGVNIFTAVSEEVLQEIQQALKFLEVPKGQRIFKEGDDAEAMYIILKGSVKVHRGGTTLTVLSDHQAFGEFALIEHAKRTASVSTLEDSQLLVLDSERFYKLLNSNLEVAQGIMKSFIHLVLEKNQLEEALKQSNEGLEVKVGERTRELEVALGEVQRLKDQLEAENVYLKEEIKGTHNFEEILTQSNRIREILVKVEQVAATDASVLILGETGTGKELFARAIHNISPRSKRPIVKVNSTALPKDLIESELFGHEKGAFTGAIQEKIGRFELADGGTIFLDEIGDMPMDLQVKLLRVLQEGEFEKLGNPKTRKVDLRVIAATNRDLEKEIREGNFRMDLFYRLNVFPIEIPPLRERKEDIPLLVKHFVRKFSAKTGKHITTIPQRVLHKLHAYNWPGNIRELENIIERAVIISTGNKLQLGDWFAKDGGIAGINQLESLEEIQREHILAALELTAWRVSGDKGAAKVLGVKPTTLEAKMKKLGITRQVS